MNRERIHQALDEYYQKTIKSSLSMPALKACMEPIFQEEGFRKEPEGAPSIVVLRDDAAGDFVLFSPFLRELRRIYEGAKITLLCSTRNIDLARCCPYVDDIILNKALDGVDGADALRRVVAVAKDLLEYNFDLAFSPRLGINCADTILAYMCGATHVVAFTNNRYAPAAGQVVQTDFDTIISVAAPMSGKCMSDVDRNLVLLEHMLKAPIKHRQLEMWMSRQDMESADAMLAEFVNAPARSKGKKKKGKQQAQPPRQTGPRFSHLLCAMPGASLAMKRWPIERYVSLFRQILKEDPTAGVVIMGGPQDKDVAAKMQRKLGDRAINFAGRCSYRQSAAIMRRCSMYIGNDTGMMHIAAALKVPVLNVNCFPASMRMITMSIPVRFAPYMVPNVTCLPATAKDGCDSQTAYGCKVEDKPHCILGVTVDLVWKGYHYLLQRIKEGNTKPMFVY